MIEPATSGGPLLGADGRVVAVSTQLTDGDGDASYAIPINTVRDVLAQLEEDHKVIRPYLGLQRAHRRRRRRGRPGLRRAARPTARGCMPATRSRRSTATRRPRLADLLERSTATSRASRCELHVLRDGSQGDVDLRLDERPATVPGCG